MQGQRGGALMWSVVVHFLGFPKRKWSWGFPGGAGQGKSLPVVFPGPHCWAIKQSEVAATCAGLGDSQMRPSCECDLAAARAH